MLKLSQAHIIGTVISYLLGVFIVPVVIAVSKRNGLVDVPNERKIHVKPISRLGGVAIWSSTILTFAALVLLSYYPSGSLLSGILIGSSLMFFLGFIDDIYQLEAKFKFVIQFLIASVVFLLGIKIDTVFSIHLNMIVSYIFTVLWIVGISNAVNFIDGVDGLAGSVITISAVTLGLISTSLSADAVSALIAFILVGAVLAFLTFNFNPAKIFMGDSGALFCGFLLATLSITGIIEDTPIGIIVPMFILAIPILDISYSSLRRILKGVSPFHADSEHIHHKLLHAGFSQNKTVLTLVFFALCFGLVAALLMKISLTKFGIYALIIIIIMLLLSIYSRLTAVKESEKD